VLIMKKDIKNQVKELSDLRVAATKAIQEYNVLAKKIDFEERLALMSGHYYGEKEDDEDDEEGEELKYIALQKPGKYKKKEKVVRTINDKVEESDYPVSCSIHVPGGSAAWFPSDICPGY